MVHHVTDMTDNTRYNCIDLLLLERKNTMLDYMQASVPYSAVMLSQDFTSITNL